MCEAHSAERHRDREFISGTQERRRDREFIPGTQVRRIDREFILGMSCANATHESFTQILLLTSKNGFQLLDCALQGSSQSFQAFFRHQEIVFDSHSDAFGR